MRLCKSRYFVNDCLSFLLTFYMSPLFEGINQGINQKDRLSILSTNSVRAISFADFDGHSNLS